MTSDHRSRPLSVAAHAARAALCEVGRPDLAEQVFANRIDNPTYLGDPLSAAEQRLVVKAFTLGHAAAGHDVRHGHRIYTQSIHCITCFDRIERMVTLELECA